MSITSQIEHEGGRYTIHHNGVETVLEPDFSGDARITLDRSWVVSLGTHECQVKIPIAALKELIGRDLQSTEIGRIEQMSGAEFLERSSRGIPGPSRCESSAAQTEDTMTETELAQIATDTATAISHRTWAIGEAHRAGLSLRRIAACVGMSHSGVKLIVDAELRS